MPDRDRIWTQQIVELARRNESIELCPALAAQGGGAWPGVRVRLLSAEPDGSAVVERPTAPGSATGLRAGAAVTILMMVEGQRWEASSTLSEPTLFRLNDQQTVRAWRLTPPKDIRSAQRRAFYRADTGGAQLEPVLLEPILPEDELGPPIEAHLVNIGGGGLGVTVPLNPAILQRLKASRKYRCSIRLPRIEPSPMVVIGELVHLRRTAPDLAYLGMTFRSQEPAARRFIEDTIVRFTTWLQREHIRRERRRA